MKNDLRVVCNFVSVSRPTGAVVPRVDRQLRCAALMYGPGVRHRWGCCVLTDKIKYLFLMSLNILIVLTLYTW
jgi:hypothetical protein